MTCLAHMPETGYGLVANVLWDSVLRIGAKVRILGYHGDYSAVCVRGLSKGGREVRKYLPMKRLYYVRAAWIPPRYWPETWCRFATKAAAVQAAAAMTVYWHGVQCFYPDQRVLRSGMSDGEADQRWRVRHTGQHFPE